MQHAEFQVGVKALFVNSGGRVLLLRSGPEESRYGDQGDFWDLPGGRIAPGEGIEETLERELKEELGLEENQFEIKSVFDACISSFPPLEGKTYLLLLVYGCRLKKDDAPFVLSGESCEWKWVSPEEAAKLLEKKFGKRFCEKIASLL